MDLIVATPELLRRLIREEFKAFHLDNFKQVEVASEQRKILSLTEFCEYVGISKQTAYKLTSGQKVPHSKRGKRIFFDREKVDEWLLENQVATVSEVQQEANDFIDSTRRRHK